ncbi:MAG: hypothetical protein AAF656_01430 [Planctomycetota bacterium]
MNQPLTTAALLAAFVALPAAPAAADFVLFGDPDPEAAELTRSTRAEPPMSQPYFSEDAMITTDIRPYFLYHDFPNSSVINGGRATVIAAQVRVALTDSLQFVAYKDGYTDLDTGLVSGEGLMDVAAGIKWAFLQDWENQFHLAGGVGYEFSLGDDEVLQDDDEVRLFLAGNKSFDKLHFSGTVNYFHPVDGEDALGDSSRITWNLHADYAVTDWFAPVLEFNGFHVVDEGDNTPLPFIGVDVANLGGGQGEDVVTIAPGIAIRPTDNLSFRTAFETPITDNDDLFGYRWTFSAVIRF